MGHDVFISYASRDKKVADQVCKLLEDNGIDCWIASRDVTPGKEWGQEIVEAISNSKIMVVVFSSAANHSQQVLREVERAVNKNVIIIPFRIEDTLPTKSMEYFLYSTHWLNALDSNLNHHIEQLLKTISKLMESSSAEKNQLSSSEGLSNDEDNRFPVIKNEVRNKWLKKIIIPATVLLFILLLAFVFFNLKKTELEIGDYINFGSYNGKQITWQVIDINDESKPLLLASSVISIKPFDAPESGMCGVTLEGRKADSNKEFSKKELREMWGSNSWYDSNLREWLNSEEENVKYSTYPPAASALYYQSNSYEDEKGFLTNFTDKELDFIFPIKHKTLLSEVDLSEKDGGVSVYKFKRNSKIQKALANYDQAFYRTVTDKIFLLSVDEVYKYLWNNGMDIRSGITEQAVLMEEFENSKYIIEDTEGRFMWWLRTPYASSSHQVCAVDYNAYIEAVDADNIQYGVRPALFLNSARYSLQGEGTEESPYKIK